MSTAPFLELRGIVKRFPGVLALNDVGFDIRVGEVHALLGETVPQTSDGATRFLVVRHQGADWIFPVDEVRRRIIKKKRKKDT